MRNAKSKGVYWRLIYFAGSSLYWLGEVLMLAARALGALSVITGLLSGLFGVFRMGLAGVVLSILIIGTSCVMLIVMAAIGSLLSHVGKKLRTIGSEDLLKLDTRNPVVYLRSFAADRAAASTVAGGETVEAIHPFLTQFFTSDTEEEVLTSELKRIGPCVAAGIPGERLPPIGAVRKYFEDHEWEKEVRTLMRRAELVVIRAGTSNGVLLELQMAVQCLDPRRLIILIPVYGYEEFRALAGGILPKELPQSIGGAVAGSSVSGVIHFQPDWTPKYLGLSEVGNTLRESFEAISKRYSNYGEI